MTLPSPFRIVASVVALAAGLLAASFIAGQCRGHGKPEPPKVIPGKVDPGTPVAGPVAEAPTIPASVSIKADGGGTVAVDFALPDLTPAQVAELARKYGLTVATKPASAQQGTGAGATIAANGDPDTAPSGDRPANRPTATFPIFLAEEIFRHEASGSAVEVAAVIPGEGQRVDLRAAWRDWTPPPVCPSGGIVGNEARFTGFVGAGGVVSRDGAGPGAFGGLGYRGFRFGRVALGADAIGGYSAEAGGFAAGGLTLAW